MGRLDYIAESWWRPAAAYVLGRDKWYVDPRSSDITNSPPPPPIILTTAFVIFGAWRRAVRDAEVDAVGEDSE